MKVYHGITASQGVVRARIIKLYDENDFSRVGKGVILLVRKSSPSWIIPLIKAGGMICEVGGAFSHIAIICRELNKPCITGIEGIFDKLSDGEDVMIDGEKGEVIIYDRETNAAK